MVVFGHPAQDVLCAGEGDGHARIPGLHDGIIVVGDALFDLVVSNGGGPVVRHGGSLDQDIGVGDLLPDRVEHVRRGGDVPRLYEGNRVQGDRAGDQDDLGAAQHGLVGNGVAHLARAVVGQIADGIQGLLGGAGRHDDLFSRQGLFTADFMLDPLAEDRGLRQLAAACVAAGQVAAGRINDLKSVFAEQADIVPGDRVFQHGRIHGRGDQLFALCGQDDGREHIVRDPVGHFGDDIRRGRGDQDQVRLFGDGNMAHVKLKVPVEGIDHTFRAGQGLKGQGGDKFGGILRHDDVDLGARLVQGAGDVGHFVGGDAAGDPQKDTFTAQVFHRFQYLICRLNVIKSVTVQHPHSHRCLRIYDRVLQVLCTRNPGLTEALRGAEQIQKSININSGARPRSAPADSLPRLCPARPSAGRSGSGPPRCRPRPGWAEGAPVCVPWRR